MVSTSRARDDGIERVLVWAGAAAGAVYTGVAFDSKQGLSGSAGVPSGVSTLTDLEAAIRSELGMPDTATAEPAADHVRHSCRTSWPRLAASCWPCGGYRVDRVAPLQSARGRRREVTLGIERVRLVARDQVT